MNKIKFRLEIFVFLPLFVASILAIILYPLETDARLVQSPSYITPNWRNVDIQSAFGHSYVDGRDYHTTPVYVYADIMVGGADLQDTSWNPSRNSWDFISFGAIRNLNTFSQYVPITNISPANSTTGIDWETYTGIAPDYYGYEDGTLKYAMCDGIYPDPSSLYYHHCVKGYVDLDSGGSLTDPRYYNSSVVPYSTNPMAMPAFRSYFYDWLFKWGNAHTATSSISEADIGFSGTNSLTKAAYATCPARNICTDATHRSSRNTSCDYLAATTCAGICINGTCDPTPQPAANVATTPISPVTVADILAKPNILTTGGLLQCHYKKDVGNVWVNNTVGWGESYYVDQPYSIDAFIPSSAKFLLTWVAPDLVSSTAPNQQPIYHHSSYDLSYTTSNFNASTRVFHLDIFPATDGWSSFSSDHFVTENDAKNVQYGAYGRGDSYVLQLQAIDGPSYPWWNVISVGGSVGNGTVTGPPQVTQPSYYHYTMPTFQQCAGPGEVTPVIASSTVSLCPTSSRTQNISWTAVPGADQYLVDVRKASGVSMYDGQFLSDFTATTTSTSYAYAIPNGTYPYTNFAVKVYAHNANGWNISNKTATFSTIANCSCSTTAGVIIPPDYGQDLYNATSSATSPYNECDSQYRSCDGSTGILSGTASYKYATCTFIYPSCKGPDNAIVPAGSSTTYYLNSTSTTICYGGPRSCPANNTTPNGPLGGNTSYTKPSCSIVSLQSCTGPDGTTFTNGQSKTYYSTTSSSDCSTVSYDRVCDGYTGTLSGSASYQYPSCTTLSPCYGPDGTRIESGDRKFYYNSQVEATTCNGVWRTCNNGVLSGATTYRYPTCNVIGPYCIGPDGTVFTNGQGARYYKKQVEPVSCVPITRVCNGATGDMSGDPSYIYKSCIVSTISDCTGPDGTTIPLGQSKEYYASDSVGYGENCDGQVRSCDYLTGNLSGGDPYIYPSCSTGGAPTCTGPDGTILALGEGKTYYTAQHSTTNCDGQLRICDANSYTLTGDDAHKYPTCVKIVTPSDCTGPDGSTILYGEFKTYYDSPNESDIHPCASRDLYCTIDGLDDPMGFIYPSCPNNKSCTLPSGETIADGATNVKVYKFSTNSCSDITKYTLMNCNNGVLTGGATTTYKTLQCEHNCIGLDGETILDGGDSKPYYASTTGTCLDSITMHCDNGALTGGDPIHVFGTCTPTDCVNNGLTILNHATSTFYKNSTTDCTSVVRTCTDGVLDNTPPLNLYTENYSSCINTNVGLVKKFKPDPAVIKKGDSCQLKINIQDATNGCFLTGIGVDPGNADGDNNPNTYALLPINTGGTYTFNPITSALYNSQKYKLQCWDGGGAQIRYATCIVNPLIKEH